MISLFGRKKDTEDPAGRTVLLLHVDTGSIGSALARFSPEKAPKLFGEIRIPVPVTPSRDGHSLSSAVAHAASAALRHASEVAARIRLHPKTPTLGKVERAYILLSAPWGRPNLEAGRPDFLNEMTASLEGSLAQSFGDISSSLYTAASVGLFGTKALLTEEPCLVCLVGGEVSELMHLTDQGVGAHATIPSGAHTLYRTLQAHGGLSFEEAYSAARLPFEATHLREPQRAAAEEFAQHCKDAAAHFLQPGEVKKVFLIAEEPLGEWFAQALSASESLAELFPNGGEVRALRTHHVAPHIAAHAAVPDLSLMLAALFVDSHRNY